MYVAIGTLWDGIKVFLSLRVRMQVYILEMLYCYALKNFCNVRSNEWHILSQKNVYIILYIYLNIYTHKYIW